MNTNTNYIYIYIQNFNRLKTIDLIIYPMHPHQLHNLRSFSTGTKFKSKHNTLILLDFFITGTACTERRWSISKPWLMAALCLLMWPPSACPMANSSPHTGHPCVFGFAGEVGVLWNRSPAISLGFLWLARWPPRAWNDGNCRSHVLHTKARVRGFLVTSIWPTLDRSIKQLAMSMLSTWSPSSLPLFICMNGKLRTKHDEVDIFECGILALRLNSSSIYRRRQMVLASGYLWLNCWRRRNVKVAL